MVASLKNETRKYATSPTSILKRVRSLTKVKYCDRYNDQYVAISKGQRLIFKNLSIDLDAKADSDGVDAEKAIEADK